MKARQPHPAVQRNLALIGGRGCGKTSVAKRIARDNRNFTLLSLDVRVAVALTGTEPNPPTWPSSVTLFDSETPDIRTKVGDIYNQSIQDIFGDLRIALLFKPGIYNVDVPVGYYTQVLGLGQSPDAKL